MITVKGRRYKVLFNQSLNYYEELAGSVYYAANSIKHGTTDTVAVDQDSVGKILDKKAIGRHLNYAGIDEPSVIGVMNLGALPYTGRPPILSKGIGTNPRPSIRLENLPNIHFLSEEYTEQSYPFAVTFVLRSLPGQEYEAWCISPYLADNDRIMRVGSNSITFTGVDTPAFHRNDIIHLEVDAVNVKIWMNGVLKGTMNTSVWTAQGVASIGINSVGTNTNGAIFDFYAMYVWYNSNMADLVANRTTILQSIGDKWLMGSYPSDPYIDYAIIELVSGTFYCNIEPVNATEGQIDAAEYRWFLCQQIAENGGGSFAKQTCVADTPTITAASLSGYADKYSLSCYVKLGGSSRYIKSYRYEYI